MAKAVKTEEKTENKPEFVDEEEVLDALMKSTEEKSLRELVRELYMLVANLGFQVAHLQGMLEGKK